MHKRLFVPMGAAKKLHGMQNYGLCYYFASFGALQKWGRARFSVRGRGVAVRLGPPEQCWTSWTSLRIRDFGDPRNFRIAGE